jgi:hypothetical protein
MYRSLLFICFIITVLLSSCGFQERHDSQEFYNRLNGINDSFEHMVTQWHDSLDQALFKKNYTELATVRTSLGVFISSSRLYVANIPNNPNNEKIKALEDSLFVTQAAKVTDIYPVFEQFSALTPSEVVAKNKALLYDDLDAVKAQLVGIRKAQAIFADKYSLKKAGGNDNPEKRGSNKKR